MSFTNCISLINRNADFSFLHRIVTRDEKCDLHINRKLKRQLSSQNEKSMPILKPELHSQKSLFLVEYKKRCLLSSFGTQKGHHKLYLFPATSQRVNEVLPRKRCYSSA